MAQNLNKRQEEILNGFLGKFENITSSKQYEEIKQNIGRLDLTEFTSELDSLNHAAPEERASIVSDIYLHGGLRELLKDAGLSNQERANILNNLAGETIVRLRGREKE